MDYAREHALVVLTHDLDFGASLVASQGSALSVVQICAGDVSPDNIADLVIVALQTVSDELGAGALVTVDPKRTRLTLLPLNRG